MPDPIQTLRTELRARRRGVSVSDRADFSQQITQLLSQFSPFQQANRVALYVSTSEEVDTVPAIHMALEQGKELYLPVINTENPSQSALLFARYEDETTVMKPNHFGIPEPDCEIHECLQGLEMELVCVPLVGFNRACHRIGMGGGYYDRTFEKSSGKQAVRGAFLVGLAFECQQVTFDARAHDVPLDAVITEQTIWQN
ncbi:MAG: 5-formyltetrahydrofolate cyclo-ligase [Pseudomonadota bacterium]